MTVADCLLLVEHCILFLKLDHQYESFEAHPQSWALAEDHTSCEPDPEASNLGWQSMRVDFAGFSQGKASRMAQVHQEVSCLDKVKAGSLGFFRSYFGYFCGSDLDLVLQDALACCLVISILVVPLVIRVVVVGHSAWEVQPSVRSDIMAGQHTCLDRLDLE